MEVLKKSDFVTVDGDYYKNIPPIEMLQRTAKYTTMQLDNDPFRQQNDSSLKMGDSLISSSTQHGPDIVPKNKCRKR